MIITLKGADFSNNNIGPLSSWLISREIGDGARYSGPTYVSKGGVFSATIALAEGYRVVLEEVKILMGEVELDDVFTLSEDGKNLTININEVTGNIFIKIPTSTIEGTSDYTLTIEPDPSDAVVTLVAAGYTQSGNSITVPNGTVVSWTVSAEEYIEQTGIWTANGSDETMSIVLDKESTGDDTGDLTPYIQEGKAIMKAGELSDNASFFSVVNYPVKGATYYLIPYARNAFCLTSTGGASGGIVAGGGNPDATIRAAGTAATMSVCFKYDDISPSEVTITETTAPTTA